MRLSPSSRLSLTRAALGALSVVGFATFVEGALFGVWSTALFAFALVLGAHAALRARTWGVGVAAAAAAAFATSAALGFGPTWFYLVSIAGAAPFVLALRPMARFDRAATALFASIAAAAGALGAAIANAV